jgi:hypothetical protein
MQKTRLALFGVVAQHFELEQHTRTTVATMYSFILHTLYLIQLVNGAALIPTSAIIPLSSTSIQSSHNVTQTSLPHRAHRHKATPSSSTFLAHHRADAVDQRRLRQTRTRRAAEAADTPSPTGAPSDDTTVHINDQNDFALLLPNTPGGTYSLLSRDVCRRQCSLSCRTRIRCGERWSGVLYTRIRKSCLHALLSRGAHTCCEHETCTRRLMDPGKTADLVGTREKSNEIFWDKVTGCLDTSKFDFAPADKGGQFDVRYPNGAQCTFGGYGASFIEQCVALLIDAPVTSRPDRRRRAPAQSGARRLPILSPLLLFPKRSDQLQFAPRQRRLRRCSSRCLRFSWSQLRVMVNATNIFL